MRVSISDPARVTEIVPTADGPSEVWSGPESAPHAGFGQVLEGIGRELARGEAATRSAIHSMTSGPTDPAQLIALQTGVYRYSEAIDLASRLVDRVTGSVKTVLQGTGQ